MITLDELCAALDGLGIEWVNEQFADDARPTPPYIGLAAGDEQVAYADDGVWARWMPYEILLYTPARDYEAEQRIADALGAAGCDFEKSINNIDGEGLVEASFAVVVTE